MSRRKSLWWYIVSKVSILQDLFCTLRCVSDMLRAVNQTGKDKWSQKASLRKENIKDTELQDENLSTL